MVWVATDKSGRGIIGMPNRPGIPESGLNSMAKWVTFRGKNCLDHLHYIAHNNKTSEIFIRRNHPVNGQRMKPCKAR